MSMGYLALEVRRAMRSPRFVIFTVGMPIVLFLLYVAMFARNDPKTVGVAIGLMSAVSLLVVTTIEFSTPRWDGAMLLVVMTLAMFGFTRLHQLVAQLREVNERAAELAVAEERARLSRDLHDVLGHSLTTITVKAGLARRVLESSKNIERAIAEVSDVEHLSRQALTEVRATVSGYRTASLPAELAGARAALRAAEIDADLPHAVDNVPVPLQEPFAYVLREGITNVIRHSGASRCEVRLGESWIEVRDDGRPKSGSTVNGGHGLTGLTERLARLVEPSTPDPPTVADSVCGQA